LVKVPNTKPNPNVKCVMKIRAIPLFTVCGVLAGFSLSARALEAPQTPSTATVNAAPNPAAPAYSGRINDVVALTQSGVDESVVLSFIKASQGPFQPSADEIIKLHNGGVSSTVISAMLQREAELRSQTAATTAQAYAQAAQAPVMTEQPPQ